jgi:hypothetical protein
MARAFPVRDRSGRQRQGSGRPTLAGPASAWQTAAVPILARSGEQRAPPTRLDSRFLAPGRGDTAGRPSVARSPHHRGEQAWPASAGLPCMVSDQVASPMTRAGAGSQSCSPASAVGSGAGVDWPGRGGRGPPEGGAGRTSGGKGDGFSAGALTGPRAGPENHALRRRFSAGNPLRWGSLLTRPGGCSKVGQ